MTLDDARRWAAVVRRDATFNNTFVYCVKSTKIFCRPICKARLARRTNVEFCDTPAQAQALGYRPCKRCQPLLATYNPEADKIQRACDLLERLPTAAPLPGLEELARVAGLTKCHFHRLFKRETGRTPREYALACRKTKEDESSTSDGSSVVTPQTEDASQHVQVQGDFDFDLNAAWNSLTAGEYDLETFDLIGFTADDDLAKQQQSADRLETLCIYYDVVDTVYGKLLVAFEQDQVCKLELGTSDEELMASLEAAFSSLYYVHSPVSLADEPLALSYQQRITAVVDALERPEGKMVEVPIPPDVAQPEAVG